MCDFEGKDAEAWTSVVLSLSERIFKFALNSTTDTLPHNKNLCLWKKLKSPSVVETMQTFLHIHNNFSVALEKKRYTDIMTVSSPAFTPSWSTISIKG